MARPRKEGMDYFPHDANAVNDKKIEALRMLYGNDGYAFYFILLEIIYQEPTFELDVSDAETRQILARKVAVTDEKFESMLETSIKRDCFDIESYQTRQVLTSNGIKKRANVVIDKRVKMQEYHAQQGNKVSGGVSDAEMGEESTQRKGKESKRKVKESINKTLYAEQVLLTENEYEKIVEKYGNKENAKWAIDKLSNYKCSKTTKYKSDYHVLIGWVFDEFEKRKLTVIRGGQTNAKHGTGHGGRTDAELDALSL